MERVDANLIPFAKNNPSGYRFAFGTDTATDDINANYNDNIKKGWGTTPNEFPEVEDFNAMAYTSSYLTAYLYQMGIAEWNNKQNYRINSRVIGSDGNLYKSLTGTIGTPNVGKNPTIDAVNWVAESVIYSELTAKTTPVDADLIAIADSTSSFSLKKLSWANVKATLKTYFDTLFVALTGNQTIAGVKTFSSNIVGNITGTADALNTANNYTVKKITATSTTQDDHTGLIQAFNPNTNGNESASVTTKNNWGIGQMMQWAANGMRIGSRIVTNGGSGDVHFTAGNDITRMLLSASTGILSVPAGINANAATATALSTAVGSAPSYACRAWVNFNGSGTAAIRASGNVSSITDHGTGYYTVNFTAAMPDANYSEIVGSGIAAAPVTTAARSFCTGNRLSTSISVVIADNGADIAFDMEVVNVSIFR